MQISSVEQNNINNKNNTSYNATVNIVQNNLSYVKKCQQILPITKQLCFAVANVRSARNKTDLIIDHVVDNKIDLCVLTETWLKDEDSVSIFRYHHQDICFIIVLDPRSALEAVLD